MSPASTHVNEASILLPLPRLARLAPVQADTGGRALSLEQVSSLLWHGIGFSRHVRGRAALPRRLHPDLQVFAILPEGAYRYDPHEHRLQLVVPSDLRPLVDGAGAREAALHLLYVTEELPRAEEDWEECGRLALEDVDRIAAHLGARCAEQGLVCGASHRVPPRLRVALRLHPAQHVALVQRIQRPAQAPC